MRELLRGPAPDAEPERMLLPPGLRLALGLILIIVSWTFLLASETDLRMRDLDTGGTPMRFVTLDPAHRLELHALAHDEEEEGEPEIPRYPGVVVAHGFGGSSKLMLGYGHVLARAGFGVLLVDFPGHGNNASPMRPGSLQATLEAARERLLDQPEIDRSAVGLLGHSMGARAVIDAGFSDPEMARATVAISPVDTEVGREAPRNLQLQAGSWEPEFLAAARELLRQAGGPSSAYAAGRARELVVVDWAEHLSILFRDASHLSAVDWFESALGEQELVGQKIRDRRMIWWLVHVTGFLLLASSLAPVRWRARIMPRNGLWPQLGAFVGAPLAAAALLWLVSYGVDLAGLAESVGMLIGPVLALWFLLAGVGLLGVGTRIVPPTGRQLLWGAGTFAVLWLALGVTADFVWLSWGLEGARVWLWALFGIACVPWFVGMESLRSGARGPRRLVWWLLESVVVCTGLWILAATVPGMGVVALMLPVLPFYLGCLSVVAGRVNDPWASGIGGGLFLGWLWACIFPLVG